MKVKRPFATTFCRKKVQKINRDSCIRCGTCCLKGGPTLHHEDKELLLAGYVGHQDLITIRKGELVFDPLLDALKPAPRELVKVRGKGKEWSCCFFDEKSSACTIYEHRLLECRLLKCWDTSALEGVVGRNTIVRADIINPRDPILEVIEMHERECPCQEVEELLSNLSRGTDKSKTLARLDELVRKDLAIRVYAIKELGLREEFELFIFGRPLFKVLSSWEERRFQGSVYADHSG
ncbi:YkgJ family cysteine cluster protein [Desulfofundulus salinus]|uniref:YkgJ family cysteine cluster protein n=1 Tax=Desulfofundulus salinus TaxID=2419843 RepID=A0A494X0Q2_9FIRM|nr:YkgJ family cysteine cluster protein [Desulfofundulus salinum]